jgi:ATP-dependent RNA helicase DDX47/RRP3
MFFPFKAKDTHLVWLANELAGRSMMVFVRTVHDAQRVSIVLRTLGFPAIPLHGQLSQSNRLGALNKFKSGGRQILIATDVASRGLDIPAVDYVVNYDIPSHSKDYIHRVGRTARAGRAGKSITLVTQYDVELLQRIEGVVGKKMEQYPSDATAVELFRPRVEEAQREAAREMREKGASGEGGLGARGKKRRKEDRDDRRDVGDDDEAPKHKVKKGGRRR